MGASGIVVYRLFRSDHSRAVYFLGLNFYRHYSRRDMAIALRAACHRLRDQVDEIDLAEMEVAVLNQGIGESESNCSL